MFNTSRGQQEIYPNVLSAHQPHSAADPESPLRPAALKNPPSLMTPSVTEPLTLKPLNWNSRGVTGKERKDDEEVVGGLKSTQLLVYPSSFLLYTAEICGKSLNLFAHMEETRMRYTRGACEDSRVACATGGVILYLVLAPPLAHSHLTSCFLESHPVLLTHTLWSHFTGKILWSREDFSETEEHQRLKNISEEFICLKKGRRLRTIKNGLNGSSLLPLVQMSPDCSLWRRKTDRVNCLAPFGSCVTLLTTRHIQLKSYVFHYNTFSCFLFS